MYHSKLERYRIDYLDSFGNLVRSVDEFTPTSLISGITIANIRVAQASKQDPNIQYYTLIDLKDNKPVFTTFPE